MRPEEAEETSFPQFEGALVRDRLLAALRYDLLGPEDPDEILRQSPKTRYLVGMLAPNGTMIETVEDEQELAAGDDEQGAGKAGIPAVASMEASSIGLSVVVDGSAETFTAHATWGEYFPKDVEVEIVEDPEDSELKDEAEGSRTLDDVGPSDFGLDAEEPEAAEEKKKTRIITEWHRDCLLYTSPSPRD